MTKEISRITIEQLLNVVHSYTDPILIDVVMGDAWLKYDEAKRMRDFELTHCLKRGSDYARDEISRLMKYYKDAPVWNLTVWLDCDTNSTHGRAVYCGIKVHCYYKDIREGFIAERNDIKRARQREKRRKRKEKE